MEVGRPIGEFTDEELREYACEHVIYEIVEFARAAEAFYAAQWDLFRLNFAIELFALHLRNLLDFFAPRGRLRKTDAVASNFAPHWTPPTLSQVLEEARWMADKHVAHLTTSRTDDESEKSWPVPEIVPEVVGMIERFTAQAEFVCEEFPLRVEAILRELPRTE